MTNCRSTLAIKMQRNLSNKPNNSIKCYKVSASKIVTIRYDELYHLLLSLLEADEALWGEKRPFSKKAKS